MPKTKKENQSNWKDLVHGFVGNMLEHVGENIALKVQTWISEFKRKAIGSLFVAIGISFFLNGIALYINYMTQQLFPWLGYGIVGIVTVFAGYVLIKER